MLLKTLNVYDLSTWATRVSNSLGGMDEMKKVLSKKGWIDSALILI